MALLARSVRNKKQTQIRTTISSNPGVVIRSRINRYSCHMKTQSQTQLEFRLRTRCFIATFCKELWSTHDFPDDKNHQQKPVVNAIYNACVAQFRAPARVALTEQQSLASKFVSHQRRASNSGFV